MIQQEKEDESSFIIEEVIDEYKPRLLRFIRSRVQGKEEAEDILSNVWIKLLQQQEPETIASISGWLYRVAKNGINDHFRSSVHRHEIRLDQDHEKDIHLAEQIWPDSTDPEEFKNLFWELLNDGLSELPDEQRSVFVRNELEDMTLQEIADQDQVPLKTVISRKVYALRQLRQRLKDLHDNMPD